MGDKNYKISEFAKLFGTTVKTLRFYEKIGLLFPCYINKENGYRYYCYEQLGLLSEIIQLKNAGFSLREIKDFITGNISITQKNELLLSQRETLDRMISQCERLNTSGLKREPYILETEDIYVVSEQAFFNSVQDVYAIYENLSHSCIEKGITLSLPCRAVMRYDSFDFSLSNFSAELSVCVINTQNDLIHSIPKGKFLCVLFAGYLSELPEAYDFLFQYAHENKIQYKNCIYEFYDLTYNTQKYDNPFVIELRLPIL